MREDFFYRIHILPITLPPLRDRKEDIQLLVEHFLKRYGNHDTSSVMTGNVLDQLVEYDWPGNVRELENTIQRYLTLNNLHFMPHIFNRFEKNTHQYRDKVTPIHSYSDTSETTQEKGTILRTLQDNQWNRSRTASVLGMSRNTLYRKMKQYNLNYS
jgi:transcriptional regulator with PAS, ATPase and Fis domain